MLLELKDCRYGESCPSNVRNYDLSICQLLRVDLDRYGSSGSRGSRRGPHGGPGRHQKNQDRQNRAQHLHDASPLPKSAPNVTARSLPHKEAFAISTPSRKHKQRLARQWHEWTGHHDK